MRMLMAILMTAALMTGCTDYSGNGGPDGYDGEDGQDDAGGGEASDRGGDEDVECAFGEDFVKQFHKSCMSDSDCVITFSSWDCCGTGQAVGLNKSELERFNQAWAYCLTQLPMCGCPSMPTKVEDGNSTWEHDSIRVRCSQNSCSTYLP